MPEYDVRSAHRIEVDAPAAVTYRAARDLDLGRSLPVAVLVGIRTLPHLLTGRARPSLSVSLQAMLDAGFVILDEDEPRGFVMGAVGKFWRLDGAIEHISSDRFRDFDEPGFAKAVLGFTVDDSGTEGSLLATETRVVCTDATARTRFSFYWRAIGPFSGFIRHVMLDHVKRRAESSSGNL